MRPARWRTGRGDTPNDRGAAAVEFAIVLIVLVIVIFGILDFGRYLFAKQGVTSASREGARVAAVGANGTTIDATVTSAARAAVAMSAAGGPLSITRDVVNTATGTSIGTECLGTTGTNRQITVTVSTPFDWLSPFGLGLQSLLPTASSSTAMRCEAS